MKLASKEVVAGTRVTIGHRVVGKTVYRTWNAEYTDANGKRVYPALKTTNKQVARRKALEIQVLLDEGREEPRFERIKIAELIELYRERCENKGLAPKTLAKYKAELDKLLAYSRAEQIVFADRFTEREFYRFRSYLLSQQHKQGVQYADKSVYTSLTIVKMLFKWALKQKIMPTYELASVEIAQASAKPQPCPMTAEVEAIVCCMDAKYADAALILAYTGMRVGELLEQRWGDVLFDRGELGMLHIRRGGSGNSTKDKDARFVPIHPRIRPIYDQLSRDDELVFPSLRAKGILNALKRAAKKAGVAGGIKTHSLRHHFASMVANSRVPYRMALAWMGHSSSTILDLYYHLHDEESEAAMHRIATGR